MEQNQAAATKEKKKTRLGIVNGKIDQLITTTALNHSCSKPYIQFHLKNKKKKKT
jgi:hypothetical protein